MDLNKNEDDGCSDSSGNDGTETGEGNGANQSDSITPAVIEEHDIGLLEFDKGSGKPVVSDALRTEIVKLGSQYFQNSDGPFLPTNNRSMNKTLFKRKLGNGQGEAVTRSWLIYSPHKKSAFCSPRTDVRSSEVYVEVDFESRKIHVKESFLGFIQVSQKDAKSLAETIEKQLEKDKMDLKDCRSQCYDNAAVMAGHRSGVHQRISEKNELAVFVNCDNHSLNLVGVHAAKQDTMMVTFFGTIEAMYVFFSRSTQRWEKLKRALPVAVKSESETSWSARTEAVKPVCKYLAEILKVLENLIDNENETSDTKSDANELYDRMLTYDFLTLLGFWNTLLMRIDRVQKRLQDPAMNFHDAALDLKALQDNFSDEREDLVGEALKEGLDLCEEWNVAFERRRRRKKQMAGEQARDVGLTAKEEMERVMKGTLDGIHTEMGERFTRLNDTDAKFGFLLNVKELCSYGTESTNLKKKCKNLGDVYTSDVNGQQLYQEILECRMLLSSRPEVNISKPEELLEFIVQYGDESVFPNLRIAVQIMLTVAVSIASCERSFSKLKLILSYLRASMGQDRLCDLALLSVEREETEKIDFEQIIDRFAAEKARKIRL
ncbi:zinc finger MYM-type protein 1-like [Diadema setosum]|uniref:zinc finger MYM-type protein 1-like n=1 Tax=Diadema setosum TaxID=31175 RepID=UPI003B3AFAEF